MYAVEAIVNHRYDHKKNLMLYCVKWEGFSSKVNTWQPLHNLQDHCYSLVEQYEKNINYFDSDSQSLMLRQKNQQILNTGKNIVYYGNKNKIQKTKQIIRNKNIKNIHTIAHIMRRNKYNTSSQCDNMNYNLENQQKNNQQISPQQYNNFNLVNTHVHRENYFNQANNSQIENQNIQDSDLSDNIFDKSESSCNKNKKRILRASNRTMFRRKCNDQINMRQSSNSHIQKPNSIQLLQKNQKNQQIKNTDVLTKYYQNIIQLQRTLPKQYLTPQNSLIDTPTPISQPATQQKIFQWYNYLQQNKKQHTHQLNQQHNSDSQIKESVQIYGMKKQKQVYQFYIDNKKQRKWQSHTFMLNNHARDLCAFYQKHLQLT